MPTNINSLGSDLDNLLEPIGVFTKSANVNIQSFGTDISYLYAPAANGIAYGATTKILSNGTDIGSLFSAKGTTSYGTLYSWGANGEGQLGSGTTTPRSSPVQVGTVTTWKVIAGGGTPDNVATGGNGAAIKTDGTLWAWGGNQQGQLGIGNTTNQSAPIQVGALTTWLDVKICSMSQVSMFMLKTDGTLWAVGNNSAGQLGQGNTTSYSSPVQVGALTNWAAISAGLFFIWAVKTDGTLWTWGDGAYGKLGSGSTASRSSPVQVGALTNWARPGCSWSWSTCVKTNGTLWTSGFNGDGELADGTIVDKSSPVQVGALTSWSFAVANGGNPLAFQTNGTMWGWGYGPLGAIGTGTLVNQSSPVQIGSFTNWKKGSYGSNGWLALTYSGALYSNGNNDNGQLGNNTSGATIVSTPIQVGALTNWKLVASPQKSSYAIR